MGKFYITTPIYYVNDKPHIGHAYSTFVCDALARYHRFKGEDVLFCTGTDENSQKNLEAMEKSGERDLQVYLDRMASVWQEAWKDLAITNDDFVRTTEERHLEAVNRFWNASKESGDIYLGTYDGLYCTGCEAFKSESDLIDGHCPLHRNRELEHITEENYFFKLSQYKEELLKLYAEHPEFVQPESRRNEIKNYVENHLTDISISRAAKSLQVGIPVPEDESQRIYVWFDALINYLTVVGFGTDDEKTKQWWPANVHMVGKDIIKFHCALWPAMLLSASKSDPLLKQMAEDKLLIPRTVFAHGFFTIDGDKISKSLGNAVDPRELVPTYGLDAIRYFLLREITFGEDGDFSHERLKERYQSDLANTLGNLVQRAVAMSRKYFDNRIPPANPEAAGLDSEESVWRGKEGIQELQRITDTHIEHLRFDLALTALWAAGLPKASGIDQANKFIEETKPFQLVKTEPGKVSEILYALLESCRHYAWMLLPVMPNTSKQIIEALGQNFDEELKKSIDELRAWGGLTPGSSLPEPKPIFPRLDVE